MNVLGDAVEVDAVEEGLAPSAEILGTTSGLVDGDDQVVLGRRTAAAPGSRRRSTRSRAPWTVARFVDLSTTTVTMSPYPPWPAARSSLDHG